ncbi:MAG TPA: ABC transporter permease [Balneolales bacterium]|nr:ABC transporter permease [Balneolales bacterium]
MIWNTIKLALREISRNMMRSSLTILGIVIGVAAVISMITIGGGATKFVTDSIASLGSNMLTIRPGTHAGPGGVRSSAQPFKINDAEAIQREISGVVAVAPTVSAPVIAVYGNENWSTSITGTNNGYFDVREWQIDQGRRFTDAEIKAGKLVCVIGATIKDKLFGHQDPVGATLRMGSVAAQIVGVLKSKGESTFGHDQDDLILMPLRAVQRRFTGSLDVSMIFISARNSEITSQVERDVEALMRQRRRIKVGEDDDFSVRNMAEIAKTMASTTGVMTTFLGAVAAISLLVGGIGIMNIMLVSVTERTREIGIRLAIGALGREVLMQFLVEAVILSLFGGLLGIILGLIGARIATPMLGVPFVFQVPIVIIAFVFSGFVGIIFGFFPARRAARLDPIDALRYE